MRYFLFSTIIHLLLVVGGIVFARENLEFQMAGDPTISMSMVGDSSQAMGRSEDLSLGKPASPESKPVAEKPKKKRAVEVKPKPVEKPVKRVEEVREVPKVAVEELLPEKVVEERVAPLEEKEDEIPEDAVLHEDSPETEATQIVDEESSEDHKTSMVQESKSISQSEEGSQEMGAGFVQLEDGAWAAKNQGVKGLAYGFLAQPEPEYPPIARKMGINQEVVIKVRFLIGYNGRVENIKFYDDITDFGFREEVIKTLKNWRATPLEVDGRKIKLYFYKSFRFKKLG